jgi:hypothetical protein
MAHSDDDGSSFTPPGHTFQPPGEAEGHEKGEEHGRRHHHFNLGSSDTTLTLHGSNNIVTGGDGNDSVTGGKNNNTITLGNGTDDVALNGNHNKVVMGDGKDTLSLIGNANIGRLGDGNDAVTLQGEHNKITVGNGTNTIGLGDDSTGNTIAVGSGTDDITTGTGDTDNTFSLDASTSTLLLHGSHNLVFINGGHDTITDSAIVAPGTGDHLVLHIGPLGGDIDITNFSAAAGTVDLSSALGLTSPDMAVSQLTSDGSGGALLSFTGGSIDFMNVAPGSLTSSNFHIT